MINLLADDAPDNVFLARLLLSQAGIPPNNEDDFPGTQYCIDKFEVDVHFIRIVNHGVEHLLKVRNFTIPEGGRINGYEAKE